MSQCYECKSVCMLAHRAELAVVMQSLGTVRPLYPSKISHCISLMQAATAGYTFTLTPALLQTHSSNSFTTLKLPHAHFLFTFIQ